MKSGYKVFWTDHALYELKETVDYLESKWTNREMKLFAHELEHVTRLISKNPALFQVSNQQESIRKAIVRTHNSLYYRLNGETVEILSIFSHRQDPDKSKFK